MATKRESKKPTWSNVKAPVSKLDQKDLIKLIGDLYRFSKENQTFLHTRFGIGDDPLKPYKETIDRCLCPDVFKNDPIQISKAKKAISDYSKAVGDTLGETELMVFFVECGNAFTVEYGDIDEGFYDALNGMYRRAIKNGPQPAGSSARSFSG